MKNKKVLIIVPAYNEEEAIEQTINKISVFNMDILIVNDGSIDQTECILKQLSYPL